MNQSTEGGNEDSDHGSLIHAGNTVSHVAQKFCGLCGACREHDDGAGCNANQKDNKYIDADDSTNQDEQIRNNLDQVVIGMKIRRSCMPWGADKEHEQSDQRRRKGNGKIGTEFVFHFTALSIAGGDRGIGNER